MVPCTWIRWPWLKHNTVSCIMFHCISWQITCKMFVRKAMMWMKRERGGWTLAPWRRCSLPDSEANSLPPPPGRRVCLCRAAAPVSEGPHAHTTRRETDADSPCDYNIHSLRYNNYNMMRNWRRQSLRLQHTLTQIQQLQHDEELTDAVLATTTHSVTTTTTW